MLCLLFLSALVVLQSAWVLYTPIPREPQLAALIESYRVSSSIDMGITVAAGTALSVLLLRRQTTIRALALAVFCAVVLWRHHLAELDIFFRAPMGDGSLSAAVSAWWRINASGAWIQFPSIAVLLFLALFLSFHGKQAA